MVGNIYISDNALGCNIETEVEEACMVVRVSSTNVGSEYSIYPNPFTGSLSIDLQEGVSSHVLEISTLTGALLYTSTINPNVRQHTINLSHLSPGLLLYTLRNEKGSVQSGKIVKVE